MAVHIGKQGKTRLEQRSAHADAIETSKILKRLNEQALDGKEMSAKALTAAAILLKKTLPDLKVSEITASVHLTEPIQWVGDDPDPDKV